MSYWMQPEGAMHASQLQVQIGCLERIQKEGMTNTRKSNKKY